jgi:hypothetical protein
VRWFAGFRLNCFYFSAAPADYFSSHSETHGPIGVQPVINKDQLLTPKIFPPFFCGGQTKVL